MGKKIVGIYLDEETMRLAKVKAANEENIFKFSNLVNKLLEDYLKVGESQEGQ